MPRGSSWRPHNWKNPHADTLPFEAVDNMQWRAYESGADAMLEVMIKYMDEHFGYDYSGVRTCELRADD